jgi:phosphoribosylformimino-5-aminoimidazole carboxamide ribotide isomerase
MIIFPAIDLLNGRVVRLRQGRVETETMYSEDAVKIAERWQSEGAEWLHVVNLDGAFGEDISVNLRELKRIINTVTIPVQFGGGLRDMASIEKAYSLGVTRTVLGTVAIEKPALVADAVSRFGAEHVAVGIDARNGMVATMGWRNESTTRATDLAHQMRDRGVARIVYTDIARDGMMGGIDSQATAQFGVETGLQVIASGGIASMNDIYALSAYPEIEGVIVGRALYDGVVKLREAIDAGKKNYSVS